MKIYIGSDHNGYKLKEELKKHFDLIDLGNTKLDKKDDYPDFAKKVGKKIKRNDKGILICGCGQGMCMVVNKIKNIRACLGYSTKTTKLSREDNNCNVLCLSGKELNIKESIKIVKTFLNTKFSNLKRHKDRIKKI